MIRAARTALAGLGLVATLASGAAVYARLASASVARPAATPSGRASMQVETRRPGAPSAARGAGPAEGDAAARATSCALAALSPMEREALRAALEDLATRIEARVNPLGEDLGDGLPEDELNEAAARFLPTFTAARSLTAGEWATADGALVVRAVPECDPGAPCLRLYDPTARDARASGELRARFLAWPLAAAAIVRASDAAAAARVVDAFRASIARGTSRIALVVGGRDLRGEVAEARAIREQARRVLRFARGSRGAGTRALALLAAEPAAGDLAPFLALADDEVLIVPRMGALAEGGAFADEVEARVTALEAREHVVWEARPSPIAE
jgi:hypothetical protein